MSSLSPIDTMFSAIEAGHPNPIVNAFGKTAMYLTAGASCLGYGISVINEQAPLSDAFGAALSALLIGVGVKKLIYGTCNVPGRVRRWSNRHHPSNG